MPSHWKEVRLGDVADLLTGFPFQSKLFNPKRGFPLIRIRDIGKARTETLYDGPYDQKYIVKPGSLLIGMDGDFRCEAWRGPEGLLNQRVCKVTPNPDVLDTKFLLFGINRHLKAIQKATSSLTVTHLSSHTVAQIPYPLPPLPEQRGIVAKIEALLEKSSAVREALDG